MVEIILYNLPYFFVYFVGIKMSLQKTSESKQMSTLALVAFGVLMVIWLIRMVQLCWFDWARSHGVVFHDQRQVIQMFNFLLSLIHYFFLTALLIGSFLWRTENTAKVKQPAVFAGISVVLILIGMSLSHRMIASREMYKIIPVFFIAGNIGILISFFGWRNGSAGGYLRLGETPVEPERAPQDADLQKSGMFEREDFIPFIAGVLVFGGLIIIPLVWGHFSDISYGQSLVPSLISCGIFLYAHDERGNFSLMRFVVGIVLLLMAMMRAASRSGPSTKPMFFAGGIVGYVIMLACGWAGICIVRLIRRRS